MIKVGKKYRHKEGPIAGWFRVDYIWSDGKVSCTQLIRKQEEIGYKKIIDKEDLIDV